MHRRAPFLFLLALLLSACGAVERPACHAQTFEGARFTVCRVDTQRDDVRLMAFGASGAPLRSFDAVAAVLGQDVRRVRFAMNAGMFDPAGRPIGLYVEEGRELKPINLREGPGNFHMLPNGVFSVDPDGVVHVETSPAFAARGGAPRYATQSGPMLVIEGRLHPAIRDDGPSRLIRNGVGVRGARLAIFVISEDPVSFGRLARFFRDELGCRDALFLDGSVSSLWAPALQRRDAGAPLGPMVVVTRKKRGGG